MQPFVKRSALLAVTATLVFSNTSCYVHAGNPVPPECIPGPTDKYCDSYPTQDITNPNAQNDQYIAEYLKNLRWGADTIDFVRKPADPQKQAPTFRIASSLNAQHRNFAKVVAGATYGFAFAQIEADPKGSKDSMYGIGELAGSWDNHFYLVQKNFDISFWKHLGLTLNRSSAPAGSWVVIGIEYIGKEKHARLVGKKTGTFRVCRHTHSDRTRAVGAYFINCEQQENAMEIQHSLNSPKARGVSVAGIAQVNVFAAISKAIRIKKLKTDSSGGVVWAQNSTNNKNVSAEAVSEALGSIFFQLSAKQKQHLLDIVGGYELSPAWMTCGIGCCTAEPD
ncbi:MAG: hypothetical protein ABJB66_15270 [Gemmatimonadaceae bacterium]